MLRPLFLQIKLHRHRLSEPLVLCLEWWHDLLQKELHITRPWQVKNSSPLHLFADARSTPPRIAAILVADDRAWYTDMEPSQSVMQCFEARSDKQICGLELLSIALGLSTWPHLLAGRKLKIWSDNVGAEKATSKGSSRAWDHSCIIHCMWTFFALHGIEVWIERVPTESNLADLPSREEFALLDKLHIHKSVPLLLPCFENPASWEALKIDGAFL